MIVPKGREISFKRIRAGLSMRELARRAGLNIGTISGMESKQKPVTPRTAKLICEALDADFDVLFAINGK